MTASSNGFSLKEADSSSSSVQAGSTNVDLEVHSVFIVVPACTEEEDKPASFKLNPLLDAVRFLIFY